MAERPVFIPQTSGDFLVKTDMIDFTYYSGFSVSQKQKSICSLHESIFNEHKFNKILEVSSKSLDELGVALSAFNLMITTKSKKISFSVESAFQSSKVFEGNIQYIDLLNKSSIEAKKDLRLKNSGNIIGFRFYGDNWSTNPLTAFYDWIYINALKQRVEYHEPILNFQAFTDIEFNPKKSINCQAYSLALFQSLLKRNILEEATSSRENFLKLYKDFIVQNTYTKENNGLLF